MAVIYALSSAPGRAGVSVIRLSGAGCLAILEDLIGGAAPRPRRASLRRLRDREGKTLDHGLVLWFPAPHSFTGEDCVELHVHGSRAVVQALFSELAQRPECRPAEAGEFARRAFLNGRVDLIELDGLADLLEAQTEFQRKMALRQIDDGGLRTRLDEWTSKTSQFLADVEAQLDFSDEGDVESLADDVSIGCLSLARDVRDVTERAARVDVVRDGFVVAIVGPPNAGKSSLLNCLAGHEAAIVSELPGTTRDVIEVQLDLGGVLCRLQDTAGLRDEAGPIEAIGIQRALAAAHKADLVLWVSAMGEAPPHGMVCIGVASQRDRFGNEPFPDWAEFGVSVVSRQGINDLLERLRVRCVGLVGFDNAYALRDRQRRSLESVAVRLLEAGDNGIPLEVRAEHLRASRNILARLTGRLAPEDVLDEVFARFCIGK